MDDADLRMDVLAFSKGQKAKVRKHIKRLERDVAALLALHSFGRMSRAELESLLKRVGLLVDGAHKGITAEQITELAGLSSVVTKAVAGRKSATPPRPENVLFLGATVSESWAARGQSIKIAITKALRIARTNEQPNVDAALFGRKGLFDRAVAQSEAVAEGTALSTETAAKLEAGKGNILLSGYRASAMFDSKTCLTCAALDGELFDINMVAVNPGMRAFGVAPFHPHCRCAMVPELALDGDASAIPGKNGTVSRGMTFEEWIGKKSAEYQEQYFGKGRYELWKEGKITLNDLFSGGGRALTLDELRQKYG